MSYLCNRCSGWVHSKYSGLQNAAEYIRIKDWVCSSCSSPPTLPKPQPLRTSIPIQAVDVNSFTIMQVNVNGIDNKVTDLGEFSKRHNVKVAVIQKSKLFSNSKTSSIQNVTTAPEDRCQCQGRACFDWKVVAQHCNGNIWKVNGKITTVTFICMYRNGSLS